MLIKQEVTAFIREIKNKYAYLPDEGVEFFASKLSVIELDKKDYFIKQGEGNIALGYIHTGLVRLFYIDQNGKDLTFNLLKEGDFATHLQSFLSGMPSQFHLQCLEPTVLLQITVENMNLISEKYPAFEKLRRMYLESVFSKFIKRTQSLLLQSAERRYVNFKTQEPELFKRVPVTVLCSYLGVERQTLTRIRKKLAGH